MAVSINKQTGFPEGSCLDKGGNPLDPEFACTPVTNPASILDKQNAVLAGKITVGANKVPILLAALDGMTKDSKGKPLKKEKIKLDKEYVLRFSALYFTPLKVVYLARFFLRERISTAKTCLHVPCTEFDGGLL